MIVGDASTALSVVPLFRFVIALRELQLAAGGDSVAPETFRLHFFRLLDLGSPLLIASGMSASVRRDGLIVCVCAFARVSDLDVYAWRLARVIVCSMAPSLQTDVLRRCSRRIVSCLRLPCGRVRAVICAIVSCSVLRCSAMR